MFSMVSYLLVHSLDIAFALFLNNGSEL